MPDYTLEDSYIRIVKSYHTQTKHHFNRIARGPDQVDWKNQPNPFRYFEGAPLFYLPFMQEDITPPFNKIYEKHSIVPCPVSVDTIAQLFELSLSISAWKESPVGKRALRINPSSGNLHPTEGYLIIGSIEKEMGDSNKIMARPMLSHYMPGEHALEIRSQLSPEAWNALMLTLPVGSFLIGLSSIYWRESWKYGERAFRYCQLDIGHALAGIRISAAALGWQLKLLQDLGAGEIGKLLGLDRVDDFANSESERPELMAVVVPSNEEWDIPLTLPEEAINEIAKGVWFGRANKLSINSTQWDIVDEIADACSKPRTLLFKTEIPLPIEQLTDKANIVINYPLGPSAKHVIMKRRSAVSLDGKTEISSEIFYKIIASTVLRRQYKKIPWDTIPGPTLIDLCFFAHRITSLKPGLYILVRDLTRFEKLRSTMAHNFFWERPTGCPEDLPFYLLLEGDFKEVSRAINCYQAIAEDGAFSMSMIAEFEEPLCKLGAWYYKNLFWEAGMIGQVLYLESEALNLSSTGIGCFFDDAVHDVLGLGGTEFQSLYQFSVGRALDDQRLTKLPSYTLEQKRRS